MITEIIDPKASDYQTQIASVLIDDRSGVDHIAYAVTDTAETVKILEVLGYKAVIYKKHVEKFNIYATKVINAKGDVAEIVEKYNKDKRSPIDNYIQDGNSSVYHICHKVDDFYQSYNTLRENGVLIVTKPFESYLFDGYIVSHMYEQSIGLFEIFGEKKSD